MICHLIKKIIHKLWNPLQRFPYQDEEIVDIDKFMEHKIKIHHMKELEIIYRNYQH
jgi:hypothetical protein